MYTRVRENEAKCNHSLICVSIIGIAVHICILHGTARITACAVGVIIGIVNRSRGVTTVDAERRGFLVLCIDVGVLALVIDSGVMLILIDRSTSADTTATMSVVNVIIAVGFVPICIPVRIACIAIAVSSTLHRAQIRTSSSKRRRSMCSIGSGSGRRSGGTITAVLVHNGRAIASVDAGGDVCSGG